MTYTNKNADRGAWGDSAIEFFIQVPLLSEVHQMARKLADPQTTPEKRKQVYLNTLAVYAVRNYLEWQGIDTDLSLGESWNPVVIHFHDVADLVVKGGGAGITSGTQAPRPELGSLECRPVLPEQTEIPLPPEVREERLAYIAVQFEEKLDVATLLGFAKSSDLADSRDILPKERLEPIDTLANYLDCLGLSIPILGDDDEDADDPLVQRVKERLATIPSSEIIAGLEKIIRSCPANEWRFEGAEYLAAMLATAGSGSKNRGDLVSSTLGDLEDDDVDEDAEFELQEFAERLLEKLAGIWQDFE